jgi:hypothetical protein
VDLETGKAVRVGGRLLHVACALARTSGGGGRLLTFLLALAGAAGAAWAVVRLERAPARADDATLAAQWRQDIDRAVARVEPGLQKGLKDLSADLRTGLAQEVARARDEITQSQRLAVEKAVATLDGKVDAYVEANLRRFEANEKQIQEIAGWVKEVRDLAARSASARETTAPAPTPAPAPAPEPAPAPAPSGGDGRDPEAQKRHDAEVDLWISRLKDPDTGVSFSATYKLKMLKDLRAVPALVETLRAHKDYYTRLGAASALGELRACDGVPALIEAIEDKEELVQTAALEALSAVTGRDARVMVGLTKKERRQLREDWQKWWKENEASVRQRLGQTASTTPR